MILGMGKPEILTKISIFQAIANLLLSVVLVVKVGFAGVVIATLISLTLSSLWFMAIFHRQIEYPLLGFIKRSLSCLCRLHFLRRHSLCF